MRKSERKSSHSRHSFRRVCALASAFAIMLQGMMPLGAQWADEIIFPDVQMTAASEEHAEAADFISVQEADDPENASADRTEGADADLLLAAEETEQDLFEDQEADSDSIFLIGEDLFSDESDGLPDAELPMDAFAQSDSESGINEDSDLIADIYAEEETEADSEGEDILEAQASAEETEGDYVFTRASSQVTITGYTGSDRDVVVPSTIAGLKVVEIASKAFQNNDAIYTVTLPSTVQFLRKDAFFQLKNLTKVTIDAYQYLAECFVGECPAFETLAFGKNARSYKEYGSRIPAARYEVDSESPYYSTGQDGELYNKEHTKLIMWPPHCTKEELTLSGISEIESVAFLDNPFLKKIRIEGSDMEYAYMSMIRGCSALEEVRISGVSREIYYEAPSSCTSLKSVYLSGEGSTLVRLGNYDQGRADYVEIGDGITAIEGGINGTPGEIGKLNLGKDVDRVSDSDSDVIAFSCLFARVTEEIVVDPQNRHFTFKNGQVLDTDEQILYGELFNSGTLTPVIPDSVRIIGPSAYASHPTVTGVELPDTILQIGAKAFNNDNIFRIRIPESVTAIGEQVIRNDSKTSVIEGYEDSYAQQYAEENEYHFVAVDVYDESVYVVPDDEDTWDGEEVEEITPNGRDYIVSKASQLAWVAQVTNDGTVDFTGCTVILNADLDLGGMEWTPIGVSQHPFTGSFNGQGHTISSLVPSADYDVTGLFGYLKSVRAGEGMYLQDVTFADAAPAGNNKGTCGVLAGQASVGEGAILSISGINVTGVIRNFSRIGGIAAVLRCGAQGSNAVVRDCSVTADISNGASSGAGGIIQTIIFQKENGKSATGGSGATIEDCRYSGTMDGTGMKAAKGGILQNFSDNGVKGKVTVRHCVSEGTLLGAVSTEAGGIMGDASGGELTIEACVNKMDVRSGYYAGGIAGTVGSGTTIRECVNEAYVNNNDVMACNGGITGSNEGTIEDSLDYGYIPTHGYSGGIAGRNGGTIERCYDIGMVAENAGAVSRSGAITSYNTGNLLYSYFDIALVPSGKIYEYTNSEDNCSTSRPLITSLMKEEASYITWDFNRVWKFDSKCCWGYPVPRSVTDLVTIHMAPEKEMAENECQITVVDQDGEPVEGAIVTYGTGADSVVMTTGEEGSVTMPYVDGDDGRSEPRTGILVETEGYYTYRDELFIMPDTRRFTFRVIDEASADPYTVLSCIMTYSGYRYELISEEITLDREIEEAAAKFEVKLLTDSDQIDHYEIVQPDAADDLEDTVIERSEDGTFDRIALTRFAVTQKITSLRKKEDRPIYVRVVDKNGEEHDTEIHLLIMKGSTVKTEFSLMDGISFTVPEDAPFFGGAKISLPFLNTPVSIKTTSEKVEIKINLFEYSGEEKYEGDKKGFGRIRENWKEEYELKTLISGKAWEDVLGWETLKEKLEKKCEATGKIKFGVNVFGYGTYDWGAKDADVKFYVVLEAGGGGEVQGPYLMVFEFDVSGKFSAGTEINVDWSVKDVKFKFKKLGVEGEATINGYGGIGLANVFSVGGYGQAVMGTKAQFLTDKGYNGIYQVYAKGTLGVSARLAGGSVLDWPLLKSDTYYFLNLDPDTGERKSSGLQAASDPSENESVQEVLQSAAQEELSTYDRAAYNALTASWKGASANASTLQQKAYPDSAPLMLQAGGQTAMVFLSDDTSRENSYDKSTLMYSIYSASSKKWTDPAPVWDDGTADFQPSVWSDGQRAYVVWNNASGSISSNMSYTQVMAGTEAAFAEFTGEGFANAENLTQNDSYEAALCVTGAGGAPAISYVANSEGDLWCITGTNSVYFVRKTGTWNTQKAADIDGGFSFVSFGQIDGEPVFVYGETDSSLSDQGHVCRAICADGTAAQLSGSASSAVFVPSGEGQILLVNDTESGLVQMQSLTGLQEEAGGMIIGRIRSTVTDPSSGDMAVLYTRNGDNESSAYMRRYSASTHSWSEEVAIVPSSGSGNYVESVSAAFVNGELLVTCNQRAVDISKRDYIGTNQLLCKHVGSASHLKVSSILTDPYTVAPGAKITVEAVLSNEGTADASRYHVDITDSEGITYLSQDVEETLSAGASVMKEYEITLPDTLTARKLTIRVTDPDNSASYSDASAMADIGTEVVYIAVRKNIFGKKGLLDISIQNTGYEVSAHTVEIVDADTGKVYESFAYSGLGHDAVTGYSTSVNGVDWDSVEDLNLQIRLKNGDAVPGDHNRDVAFHIKRDVRVQAVSLSQTEVTLTDEEPVITLQAQTLPEDAQNKAVTWFSQKESIATVDENGTVTGLATGTCRIYARSEDTGVLRSCLVHVNFIPKPESLSLYVGDTEVEDGETISIPTGSSKTFRVEILPQEAAESPVEWVTADPQVAEAGQDGKVQAISQGETTLTVSAGTVSVSVKIVVADPEVDEDGNPVHTVTDIVDLECLEYGNDMEESWIYRDPGASYMLVTFSEDTEVEDGYDFLIISGYQDGAWTEVMTATGVQLGGRTILVEGSALKITLSSDSSVNGNGFKVEDLSSSAEPFAITDFSIGGPDYLTVGFMFAPYIYNIQPSRFENVILPLQWSCGSNGVLSDDTYDGKVYIAAEMAGDGTVYAEVAGVKRSRTIHVSDPGGQSGGDTPQPGPDKDSGGGSGNGKRRIAVNRIVLSGLSTKIAPGKGLKLGADIYPKNASNKAIHWSSSNPKIATVDGSGNVKIIKKKTAGKKVTITAAAKDGSGVTASWTITVAKNPVKKVKITGKKTVKAGKTIKLKAKVTAKKGANKKVLWSSSNPALATVSTSGKVTASAGAKGKTVKITAMATDGTNKKATYKIKIK